jgi:hypothetical protein
MATKRWTLALEKAYREFLFLRLRYSNYYGQCSQPG